MPVQAGSWFKSSDLYLSLLFIKADCHDKAVPAKEGSSKRNDDFGDEYYSVLYTLASKNMQVKELSFPSIKGFDMGYVVDAIFREGKDASKRLAKEQAPIIFMGQLSVRNTTKRNIHLCLYAKKFSSVSVCKETFICVRM